MADFTSDELIAFRRQWVRDLVAGSEKLSDYNRANGAEYLSDEDIQAIKARVELDNASELAALHTDHEANRKALGDSDADATTSADTMRLQAVYRLCRAEVYEMMLVDPGYYSSLSEAKDSAAFYANMRTTITRDRNFVRKRAGSFASVDIVWR